MLAPESCSRSFPCSFAVRLLIALHVYSFRHVFVWPRIGKVLLAAISVPFIEETFFRGIVLGILLRTGRKLLSILAVSALFAAVHFLKGSEREPAIVTWTSGFQSIGDAFAGFGDPMMVLAAFATLFLIGCILADARVLTRSLWLPIGLHAGWIFASGTFNWLARAANGRVAMAGQESARWNHTSGPGRSNMDSHAAMVKT